MNLESVGAAIAEARCSPWRDRREKAGIDIGGGVHGNELSSSLQIYQRA